MRPASLNGLHVCVAGAGALGQAIALDLVQRGAIVTLCDPAAIGDNASGVAAGMLAPGLESVLDPEGLGGFDLFAQARDAWPAFAAEIGQEAGLARCGALWLGEAARTERLTALGARAETVSGAQAAALAPGLAIRRDAVLIPDDWRVEPRAMLRAMQKAFLDLGGRRLSEGVVACAPGSAVLASGERVAADWTVFAGGQPAQGAGRLAPELAVLTPIKGQIIRFEAETAPCAGPIVRNGQVYIVPAADGPAAGATMEAGVNDRRSDPQTAQRLRAAAAALFPALAEASAEPLAGVRASTPDGLPLLGRSAAGGVLLATGARRNGWLLAPLLAQMAGRIVAGEDAGPWAAAFDPSRFVASERAGPTSP